MDIRCERCGTEYEFDESRLTEAGVTVKCTTCGHVFKVRRAPAAAYAAAWAAPAPVAAPPAYAPPRAILVSVAGQPPIACPDIGTLQRWVAERRVQREDQACWTGEPWRRAGEWPELAPFFAIVSPPPVTAPSMPPVVAPPVRAPVFDPSTAATQQLRLSDIVAAGMIDPSALATDPNVAATRAHAAPPAPAPHPAAPPVEADTAPSLRRTPAPWGPPHAPPPAVPPIPGAAPYQPSETQAFKPVGPTGPSPAETVAFRPPSLMTPPATPAETVAFQRPVPAPEPSPAATVAFRPPSPAPAPAPELSPAATVAFRPPSLATEPPGPSPAETVAFRPPSLATTEPPSSAVTEPPSPAQTVAFRPPSLATEPPPPAPTVAFQPAAPPPEPTPAPSAPLVSEPPRPITREFATTPPPGRMTAVRPSGRAPATQPEYTPGPEEFEFQKAGRTRRVATLVVLGVLVSGLAAYLVLGVFRNQIFGPPAVPPEALAAFDEARQGYHAGTLARLDGAVAALDKALKIAGEKKIPFTDARVLLAKVQCTRAEMLLAERASLEAAAKTENAAAARYNTAGADGKTALEAGEAALKQALKEQPKAAGPQVAALACYRAAGNAAKVKSTLKEIPAEAAADPEATAQIAISKAVDVPGATEAEAALADVTQKLPAFVPARWWLARARVVRGDAAAALEGMKAVVAAAPGHEAAKAWLDAHARVEAAKAAEAAAAAAAEGKPGEAKPAEAKPEDKPEAKPAEAKPAEPKPVEKPAVDINKILKQADSAYENGKAARAQALYEQVIAAKPDQYEAWYGKGLSLSDQNKMGEAIDAYKKALELNPKLADAMIGLAECYKARKQNDEAVRWYRKYVQLEPNGDSAEVARKNIQVLGGK